LKSIFSNPSDDVALRFSRKDEELSLLLRYKYHHDLNSRLRLRKVQSPQKFSIYNSGPEVDIGEIPTPFFIVRRVLQNAL